MYYGGVLGTDGFGASQTSKAPQRCFPVDQSFRMSIMAGVDGGRTANTRFTPIGAASEQSRLRMGGTGSSMATSGAYH